MDLGHNRQTELCDQIPYILTVLLRSSLFTNDFNGMTITLWSFIKNNSIPNVPLISMGLKIQRVAHKTWTTHRKEVLVKEATSLKADGETVTSLLVEPVPFRWFQI